MIQDSKELIAFFLHFLQEKEYTDALAMLGKESGLYFDWDFYKRNVLTGFWDEAESYISNFINLNENEYSYKIFFIVRKYQYLEAIDRGDRSLALGILKKDLRIFKVNYPEEYKALYQVITMDNVREHPHLVDYGEVESMRIKVLTDMREIIFEHFPLVKAKMDMIESRVTLSTLEENGIISLIFQSLDDEKYNNTKCMLEYESRAYFNLNRFRELVLDGDYEAAEAYLSIFLDIDDGDDENSTKIFFSIRKYKYLEALDSDDISTAIKILREEFTVFATNHHKIVKELTLLFLFDDIREHESFSDYGDTLSERARLLSAITDIISIHPLLTDKLQLQVVDASKVVSENFMKEDE